MILLKYFKPYCLLLSCLSFLYACKNNSTAETPILHHTNTSAPASIECLDYIAKGKQNNLNISVLLDLSDRIETPKTITKDSAYLVSLSKVFVNHIKQKKVILLADKMQLFFYPYAADPKINTIAEQLKVNFTKTTPKAQLKTTLQDYTSIPTKLYNIAKTDAKLNKGYPGCDIWRFFKDHVKDYCISECHRNIVVILTDGYMYYDKTKMATQHKTSYLTPKSLNRLKLNTNAWKNAISQRQLGFIPATSNLNDLEVLILGVTSKNPNNPYAIDIIKTYWSNWLEQMGIQNYKIKNAGLPSHIEHVISDFIIN